MEMSQDKTLFILHGWQSSKEKWQRVKENLEASSIKVIIPDLPGFGKENELDRAWNLDDYVSWLRNLIEEACPEPAEGVFLLGHSFGGRIAIKLAAKYPEKLSGLILVSAAGITPRPKIKITVFSIFSKIGNLIFSLPILKIFRPLATKSAYLLAGANDYRFIENLFLKQTFKGAIAENLTLLLPEIKTPTLIIWGEKDKITPLKDAYFMNKKIDNSKLEILKNTKHLPYLENPKLLAQKIVSFLKNHENIGARH